MADSSLDLGTLAYTVTVKGADKAKQTMGELKEEIQSAEQEGQRSFDSLSKGGEFASKGMVAITAAAAAAATALVKLSTESIKFADNWQGAMNDFQAQTGATNEEMEEFSELAEHIYTNNFGDNIEDIAASMANVKQQTGMTGDELERTTQTALMMRDTFDWEVQESVRAVDMMMKQFGITSDEAYTLLAQGAQQGLDKNDNLLDTLNEYSPYFSQLGFDAEETFGILAEGAEAGAFDIDKLGDAMKEFNIRVKDGSDTTRTAFNDLGLDADLMQEKFAAGGQQAQHAFRQVVNALNNTEDAFARNAIGVSLFGTMWEDLEVTTVTAMLNANSAFDETAGTLQQIEAVKYNTISEALEGIGRNLETSILKPIGEALLPLLQRLADWINDHMDEITAVIEVTLDVIGTALGVFIALITADTESLKEYITTALNAIVELVKKVVTDVLDTLKGLPKQALQIGKQFVQGLIDGVGSMASVLVNAVRRLASKALDAIRDAFDIHSPSRVMRDMMRDDVGGGMVLGLQDAVKPVSEAMQNLAGKAKAAISVNASGTISAMREQAIGYTTSAIPAMSGVGSGTSYGDINIYIDKVNNGNGRDVETMARELEFFRRQQAGGKGGK